MKTTLNKEQLKTKNLQIKKIEKQITKYDKKYMSDRKFNIDKVCNLFITDTTDTTETNYF